MYAKGKGKGKRACFKCGAGNHIAINCPNGNKGKAPGKSRGKHPKGKSKGNPKKTIANSLVLAYQGLFFKP